MAESTSSLAAAAAGTREGDEEGLYREAATEPAKRAPVATHCAIVSILGEDDIARDYFLVRVERVIDVRRRWGGVYEYNVSRWSNTRDLYGDTNIYIYMGVV